MSSSLGSDSDWSSSNTSDDVALYSSSLLDDFSDDERQWRAIQQARAAQTSVPRHRAPHKQRDRRGAHELLVRDYFAENPVYNHIDFKRRFRMSKRLFLRISNDLEQSYPYFQQKPDATGNMGFSTLQKCTAAVRLLAYGTATDSMDDYLKISERTARECMYKFCRKVYKLYRHKYLRKPNANDVRQLYAFNETQHGLPGMIGSLDCTHWDWKNCPNAFRGHYTRGDHGVPTIILEAVASYDMWIWHAFFGVAGSNNDINVIRQSDIFTDIFTGQAPDSSFQVNGAQYKYGYHLVDGIYPEWATLVKAFSNPQEPSRKVFKEKQEAARKDIERAFAKLKGKWHVLAHPSRSWHTRSLHKIMYAVIILHNMIIEDNNHAICTFQEDDPPTNPVLAQPHEDVYLSRIAEVQSSQTHHNLRHDLTAHVWANWQAGANN